MQFFPPPFKSLTNSSYRSSSYRESTVFEIKNSLHNSVIINFCTILIPYIMNSCSVMHIYLELHWNSSIISVSGILPVEVKFFVRICINVCVRMHDCIYILSLGVHEAVHWRANLWIRKYISEESIRMCF